ncbi:hypothetical protein V6N13_102975 [Hibiscus sabdariffa]
MELVLCSDIVSEYKVCINPGVVQLRMEAEAEAEAKNFHTFLAHGNKWDLSTAGCESSRDKEDQGHGTHTSSDPSPSQAIAADKGTPWKSFGTSMNAISSGFVATAILISMFLIMAIFEHLFWSNPTFSSPDQVTNSALGPESVQKLGNQERVLASYASYISVMMPGEQYPTHIAQPAPLPCQREGIYWPPHEHNFEFPQV